MKDQKDSFPAANETAVKTSTPAAPATGAAAASTNEAATENVTGRGVFVVETVPVGVAIRTAFLTEDGRLLESPTVFPDVHYAFAQIDELKQLVAQRFAEAAQIGAQVIAQQMQANAANAQAATTTTASATPASAAAESSSISAKKDDILL